MAQAAPPQSIIDAILAPATFVTRRVEIYESDGITLWNGIDQSVSRLIDGSVSVDGTRAERRNIDITFDNSDFALNPNPKSGFWYDKYIVPYRGVATDTASWEIPLGWFMVDNMSADNFPHILKVSGRDFTKRIMLSLFSVTSTFSTGFDLEDTITAIAANAGITQFSVPNAGTTLSADYTFDQGTSRWDAISQLASDYNYEVFFDCYGVFTLRLKLDPTLSPIVWSFKTGPTTGSLVRISRQIDDSNLFNDVLVIGGSSDSSIPPVWYEAVNTEPSSPTNVATIGQRTFVYQATNLTTTAQCKSLAKQLLSVQALESYQLSFDSIVFPWLEANDIVEILDPQAFVGDPTKYLMDSFSIPLTLSAMSGNGKRVTVVGDTHG